MWLIDTVLDSAGLGLQGVSVHVHTHMCTRTHICVHWGHPYPSLKLLYLSQAQLSLLGKDPGSMSQEVNLLLQQGSLICKRRGQGPLPGSRDHLQALGDRAAIEPFAQVVIQQLWRSPPRTAVLISGIQGLRATGSLP